MPPRSWYRPTGPLPIPESVTIEAMHEHGEEPRPLDEARELDELVGTVHAAAPDTKGVDRGDPGGLQDVAVAGTAGGGERHRMTEPLAHRPRPLRQFDDLLRLRLRRPQARRPDPDPRWVVDLGGEPPIERLHHADHVVSAQEKVDEQLSSFVGPRVGQLGAFEFDSLEDLSFDEGIVAGRMDRNPQRHDRIIGGRVGRERQGVVDQLEPMPEVTVFLEPSPSPTPLMDPMQNRVLNPGDGASRAGNGSHEIIGVPVPERRRDLVLLLQKQLVVGPPGGAVKLDPRRQERFVGPGESRPLALFKQGRVGQIDPPQRMQITQPAL